MFKRFFYAFRFLISGLEEMVHSDPLSPEVLII